MKNNFIKGFSFICLMMFFGCNLFPFEKKPYFVSADFVMEEDAVEYKVCGADILFCNTSDLTVKEFEIVFYLFDSDGEPASGCQNRLDFIIEKEVEPGGEFQNCLSLDSYMAVMPQSLLEIDYLYVSRILYTDGSVWEDPYGLVAFM